MITTKIINIEQCKPIKDRWNDLILSDKNSIKNIGTCATYEWTRTLEKAHLQEKESGVIISQNNNDITAIFPFYIEIEKKTGIPFRVIKQTQELYSTRSGLTLKNNNPDNFKNILSFLSENNTPWHKLVFSIVSDKKYEESLIKSIKNQNLKHTITTHIESPYLTITGSIESILERLNKKFRYNILSRRRKLEKSGAIECKIYSTPETTPEFLENIYSIERNSWKENNNSSITTNKKQKLFYDTFTNLAAQNNWLRGIVILFDNKPIAYSYGLLFNNVFESLKTSYSEEYKKFGPGNILKIEIINFLLKNNIYNYDLLGLVEPIKMKWTDKTYSQKRITIYNNNTKSSILYQLAKFSNNKT